MLYRFMADKKSQKAPGRTKYNLLIFIEIFRGLCHDWLKYNIYSIKLLS